jgi:hypothetical protein
MLQTLHPPRMRRYPNQPNAAQPSKRIPSTLKSTPPRARRPPTTFGLLELGRQQSSLLRSRQVLYTPAIAFTEMRELMFESGRLMLGPRLRSRDGWGDELMLLGGEWWR